MKSSALASTNPPWRTQHRRKRAILAVLAGVLLTGAAVFILGAACAMVFFSDRDRDAAGYFDCAYPLAGIFVLAVGCLLLILLAAVAISYLCYRDWNSVD